MRKATSTNALNATELYETCGMAIALRILGGRWKPGIIWHLGHRRMRYSELKALIPNISERMLVQQLKELEKHGFVERFVFPEVPPRVEYALTEEGKTLVPIVRSLAAWGNTQREKIKLPV
ncbi:helix-turn-helix domain-containing protein [Chitinophaga sp. CF418]|uniref:winged helix-turn-helix transcriptional regulator n=1 Tax=Chitinophaga sp. CF418 TaxID=1855287 RepID=UPI00122D4880|nr:helix-turn-helix domain-containing protein [Chitinophaga sp. CF418]